MAQPRYKIEIVTKQEIVNGTNKNQGSASKHVNIWKDGTWYLQNPTPEQLAEFLARELSFEVVEVSEVYTQTNHRAGHYKEPFPRPI